MNNIVSALSYVAFWLFYFQFKFIKDRKQRGETRNGKEKKAFIATIQ